MNSVACTTAGAAVEAAAQTLIFIVGAVTTGVLATAGTYTVSSSTDLVSATAATATLGGQLTTKVRPTRFQTRHLRNNHSRRHYLHRRSRPWKDQYRFAAEVLQRSRFHQG